MKLKTKYLVQLTQLLLLLLLMLKNQVKNEIPNIINLFATTALTTAENEIPDHCKYITTSELKTLIAENFTARLVQVNLASKSDIATFVKMADLMIN